MRKSCVETLGLPVQILGLSTGLSHSMDTPQSLAAHKSPIYTPLIEQVSGAKMGLYEQLLCNVYRLVENFVHILHRPYNNYNYVIK